MGRRLLNFTPLVLLGPLLVTFAREGVRFLVSVFTLEATKWFLLGAGLSMVVYPLPPQDSIAFIEDLLHEMEHAVVSVFFAFQWPKRMEINPEQGSKVEGSLAAATVGAYHVFYEFVREHVLPALGDLVQWGMDRFSRGGTPAPSPKADGCRPSPQLGYALWMRGLA